MIEISGCEAELKLPHETFKKYLGLGMSNDTILLKCHIIGPILCTKILQIFMVFLFVKGIIFNEN